MARRSLGGVERSPFGAKVDGSSPSVSIKPLTYKEKKRLHDRLRLLDREIAKAWPVHFVTAGYKTYYERTYPQRLKQRDKMDQERREVRRKLKQYGGTKRDE